MKILVIDTNGDKGNLEQKFSFQTFFELMKESHDVEYWRKGIFATYIKFFIFFFRKWPEIVFFLNVPEKIFLSGIAKMFRIKVCWVFLDKKEVPWLLRKHYQKAIRNVTILSISQALWKTEQVAYNLHPKNVVILYPPQSTPVVHQENMFADLLYKQYADRYRRNFIIGVAAPLIKANGIEFVLQTLVFLKDQLPHVQLVILGDGPEKNNLLWLAKNMNIAEHVRIVGGRKDVHSWFDIFTVFLFTQKENIWYSHELCLAMKMGRPIIAHKSPYTQELLENSKEAILLDIDNNEMVAQAIVNLANNPDWLLQFSQNAQERAHELFSNERFEKEMKIILSL